MYFVARDHLSRDRDREIFFDVYPTPIRLQGASNEREHSALACAILSHKCVLNIASHRKRHLIKNGFIGIVLVRHLLKSHYCIFS